MLSRRAGRASTVLNNHFTSKLSGTARAPFSFEESRRGGLARHVHNHMAFSPNTANLGDDVSAEYPIVFPSHYIMTWSNSVCHRVDLIAYIPIA